MEYDSLKAFKYYTQYVWFARKGYEKNKLELYACKYRPEVWKRYNVVWEDPLVF